VLRKLREGQDRVRRIGKAQMKFALEAFNARPVSDRPSHTQTILVRTLAGQSLEDLQPDTDAVRAELSLAAIPDEAVRLRAFCIYKSGQGTGAAGDWTNATSLLRDAYTQHYLKEVCGK